MERKNLLLILVGLLVATTSTSAQDASCQFINSTSGYICYLTMNNPGGLEITEPINGTHLDGMTDADVSIVYSWSGSSTIIPQQICTQFPNALDFDLAFFGITTITANSFSGCSQLRFIRLWFNRIAEIPVNAFANNPALWYLDLDSNNLTTLPETVFNGLTNLTMLELRNNPFDLIPTNLFSPLVNLQTLYLSNVRMTAFNPAWFTNNSNLRTLFLYSNLITNFPATSFNGLSNLTMLDLGINPLTTPLPATLFNPLTNLNYLYLDSLGIVDINPAWFTNLNNLFTLALYFNNITTVNENSFSTLSGLWTLDIGYNPITTIPAGTFRNLASLQILYLNSLRLTDVNSQWFVNTTRLQYLFLNFNQIEDLPEGAFATIADLWYIGLWRNSIKTIDRQYFGGISNLYYVDLDENNVNAIDRAFIEDAVNLYILYFWNNVCASGTFFDFVANRAQNMARLERCFRNYDFSVETTTSGTDFYRLYRFPLPGLFVRVIAPQEVHISLNPVNFEAVPRMEILLGVHNNTRSVIRRNGEEDVVNIPTPNILDPLSWSGFRIAFSNWMILVFREGDQFPFMGWNMQEFYPMNFYGIRSPGNVVPWSIQPLDGEEQVIPTFH